jgi:hypothetical protein
MIAGIESLIGLIIFVAISLLASWAQKKQRESQEENAPPPTPRRRVPPGRVPPPIERRPADDESTNWEEELKRLLEGKFPGSEEEPAPPPPIVAQQRPPPPPPVAAQQRSPAAAPPPADFSESTYQLERSPVEVAFKPLTGLTESAQAYDRASNLDEAVEARLRQVTRAPVQATRVEPRQATASAQQARALLSRPDTLRGAILASIVLGPPRALSE